MTLHECLYKDCLVCLRPLTVLLVLLTSLTLGAAALAAKGGNGGGRGPGGGGGGSSAPEISSISPTSGSTDGGTSVTVNGKNFDKNVSVDFGGIAAASVSVRNGKKLTAVTPSSAAGKVDVTVTNPDGQSATLAAFTFEGPVAQPPVVPSGLAATAVSALQIDLGWTDNSGDEDGFIIEQSLDGASFNQVASLGANIVNWFDTGLSADTIYHYRVAAFNGAGNSAWSNTAQATTQSQSAVVAFPGAEGFGTQTPGGRGGQVIAVTSLNDSGPGSFREAVETPGPRIVVFRTGGIIELSEPVRVYEPFITIAGQTAPGDGIVLKGEGLSIHTHDVVVRSLRVRIGDLGTPTCCRDGINISTTSALTDVYNVVIDHSSVSWAIDENIATWESSSNNLDIYDVTIQWSITSEALYDSIHVDEGSSTTAPHSMGLLVGRNSENISIHHNLMAHNNGRNPRMDGIVAGEVINNLIFDWGKDAPTRNSTAPTILHILNNFYHSGPTSRQDEIYLDDNTASGSSFYIDGNLTDDARVSSDPFPSRILNRNNYPIDDFPQFTGSGIGMDATADVFNRVLNNVGAIAPVRDVVDARLVNEVINRSGSIIDSQAGVGGWPAYDPGTPSLDSDGDGIPDSWENSNGLDPFNASDGNLNAPSGYTWIEEYINSLIPMP
ncbi:MAG: IPT/TIG domain-containing protein [bacterium]|nr:IPT/TIG domain-containing protein [bacterium]